ncbi:MAG: polyphosphate kinase 1 [Gemmatimonadales bacterium]|nr:polyphosphate kinase 1 [Gemmatimonadales bacterium]
MTDLLTTAELLSPGNLRHPSLYLNRELSWLEFNRRVLHEALDPRTPLLERLKFLGIFSSNLDEFFQVRVAGLKEQLAVGYVERTADGMTPEDQLRAISRVVRELVGQHHACLVNDVLPALRQHGVNLHLSMQELPTAERERLARWYEANVFPVLTPLAVDPGHPFPHISNLSLSLAVVLRGPGGEERFARVKVPKLLSRWVPLAEPGHYIPLEQVIAANLESLFPGVEILGSHAFRITRNTDLQIDPDEGAEDLLSVIQEEVQQRRFAEVVRIEVARTMPRALRELLIQEFNDEQEAPVRVLTEDDVYEKAGLFDAADLIGLAANLDLPHLKDPPFAGAVPARLQGRNPFDAIREGDVLLHHPYESFAQSVERLIAAAVDDPDVLAIKITLYRTGGDSSIARQLVHAAERGKQVAVLVELQARFDEENNITWAKRLEDVGAHVSYGVPGLKTHAKVLLIVRREADQIRRYVHVGTGNYNPRTSRFYTDFGLLTCDPLLGADLSDLFNLLTGFAQPFAYRQLIVAPKHMRDRFLALIRREIAHGVAGRPARILAKMNALVDPVVIAALYEASQAGVQVDLIVRGICCLRPGLAGVSDRIRVVSVIGRFLEHSRAFWFRNGGEEEVFISSADWMPRNLERRIEAAVPIREPAQRRQIREVLELMWADNRQAWELGPDGTYEQRRPRDGDPERGTHRQLMELARGATAG